MKATFTILAVLTFAGCAPRAAFVRTDDVQRPAKTVNQVKAIFEDTAVPFEYVEVGRIFIDIKPGTWMSANDQLSEIKKRAAEMGADAVLIKSTVIPYANSRTDGLMLSQSHEGLMPIFSAIAIAKK